MTTCLYRGWTEGKNLVAGTLGVTVHVDEDVDSVLIDPVRSFPIALGGRQVDEVLRLLAHLLPEGRPVVRGQGVAEDLHAGPVVHPRHGLHQVRCRVIAEIWPEGVIIIVELATITE